MCTPLRSPLPPTQEAQPAHDRTDSSSSKHSICHAAKHGAGVIPRSSRKTSSPTATWHSPRRHKRYDPSYGVPFPAFATPFVRGAIADTVRTRARRDNLGDGHFADVVGFPALTTGVREDRAYEPADPGPTPHDTVETLDRLRVLGTLPERERVALIRTIVDGDTAADVAKDLGVSPDRVYTLVQNGSTRVRRRAA